MKDELLKKLESYLEENGLRMTYVREAVLNQALLTRTHFDAETLYGQLSKKKARVSRDAVFRALPLLLEAGVLQKSVGKGKAEFFEVIEPKKGHHDHMVCTICEGVLEFYSSKLEKIQEQICKEHGFKMTFHDHRIFGHCKSCLSKNS